MLPPLLKTLRPPFLLLAVFTVLLAAALAARLPQPFPVGAALLVLAGALAAHGAVNALNEYADFRSGLDMQTEPTPFSGGSGYLPAHPDMAAATLLLGVSLLGACLAIGIVLVWQTGPALLWVGAPGVLLIAAYTPWITRNRWLSLLAPGLGFGLMLLGAELVLTGSFSGGGISAALVLGCLTNNLLLLNQLPDRAADAQVGRDNIPLRYGLGVTLRVYAVQWLIALLFLLVALISCWLPLAGALALPAFALGAHALVQAQKPGQLAIALRSNVLQTLMVPVLLTLALVVG
jgi:1,4-dihydroxy-2-naphthoate polyprenyltransferase